jgi:hypothetical protein
VVTFPELNSAHLAAGSSKTNLIMPESCPFLNRSQSIVSIIRPTKTDGAAVVIHRPIFRLLYMTQLAQNADAAQRGT